MKSTICAIIGSNTINDKNNLEIMLRKTILNIIEDCDSATFIFTSFNKFNKLCHKIISEFQINYYKRIHRSFYLFNANTENKPKFLVKKYFESFLTLDKNIKKEATKLNKISILLNNCNLCIAYPNNNKNFVKYFFNKNLICNTLFFK